MKDSTRIALSIAGLFGMAAAITVGLKWLLLGIAVICGALGVEMLAACVRQWLTGK